MKQGILDPRLGGRRKGSKQGGQFPFLQGTVGSFAGDRMHEFDVLHYFNLFLHWNSPGTLKSSLGELNRDVGSKPQWALWGWTSVSLWALTTSSHPLTAPRDGKSLCELHQGKKKQFPVNQETEYWAQGQLSHSLQILKSLSFLDPLFHPAVAGSDSHCARLWLLESQLSQLLMRQEEHTSQVANTVKGICSRILNGQRQPALAIQQNFPCLWPMGLLILYMTKILLELLMCLSDQ